MSANLPSPADVSAVVCTKNSIASIEPCLRSLRAAGVGELIVVDASSTDGTRNVAEQLADVVLDDPGTGLGQARNIGIAESKGAFILNMGSDNVMPEGQLDRMLSYLTDAEVAGVSAQTFIDGSGYIAFGLNTWRSGRFRPGPSTVIGTPTLFRGDLLRSAPFSTERSFSDDSELCERWRRQFQATFAISDAYVLERGKISWRELWIRCRMYGISDAEVFRHGRLSGWSATRQARSLAHPLVVDVIEPFTNVNPGRALRALPFLATFASMRYAGWAQAMLKQVKNP